MRFKSAKTGPYQVLAVSGTNTISFAISADKAGTKGLLGFAVERSDPDAEQDFYAFGFKVFPSLIPKPDDKTRVKTSRHPVQSFVWDDFTAKPDHKYEYVFHPLKGTPKKLDRSGQPVAIRVQTEPLFSTLEHDIFFNRGVASSQAYTREFGNKKPEPAQGRQAGRGEGMAEPPARRRHPEVHRRRRFGRHAALLLLRVPLPARGRGAEGSRRSRRSSAADRRCQEQQAQGQERQGAGGFPARRKPRHDREGGPAEGQRVPARGQDQRHPAQQVHGAAEGPAAKACRGVDRLDQHLRRRHPRPDQCRPLGARS